MSEKMSLKISKCPNNIGAARTKCPKRISVQLKPWNVLGMLLCFYWNVFNIHIQMLSDYTLI